MFRSVICAVFFALSSSTLWAQSPFSVSVTGGILYLTYRNNPGSSVNASVQYKTSEDISLYSYTGLYLWSHDVVMYENISYVITQSQHTLVPVFAGARFFMGRIKNANAFFEAEAGLSFVSYTEYDLMEVEDKTTGKTYLVSSMKGRYARETRYACGLGTGITYMMNKIASLSISYKLNIAVSPKYNSLISNSLLAGININI